MPREPVRVVLLTRHCTTGSPPSSPAPGPLAGEARPAPRNLHPPALTAHSPTLTLPYLISMEPITF